MKFFALPLSLFFAAPHGVEPKKPAPAVVFRANLATPESVLYDADTDTYLVSNINGAPTEKDNNGYIAELSPDGAVANARFISGGKRGVTLHAPKGMALQNGILYIADIDVVRLFKRKTGAPAGEVKFKGATFINDVAAGPHGRVYVSDSGLTPSFQPSGTDAVYVIESNKLKFKFPLKSKDLPRPNGLLAMKGMLHVVFFGAAELRSYDFHGKPTGKPTKLPHGGLDGIVHCGGALLVSSWDGHAVYRGKAGGRFTPLITQVKAPADIGCDSKRRRVLIPRFKDNTVEAWNVR